MDKQLSLPITRGNKMNSFTIYHGTSTPIKARGKHQVKLLDFAYRYKGWHSYATDKTTIRAVDALVKKGYLIINEHNQFKFIYPSTK
jgi:hypothetical protein